jgi:hypothetical protein
VRGDGRLRVLSAGVDSLYLSVRGELWDGLLPALADIRALGDEDGAVVQLHDDDYAFLMRPHGWRGYPFWLSSPNVELMIGAAKPFPALYTMLHSAFIHSIGVETAVAEVERVLRADIIDGPVTLLPSRIDLYADVQGWTPRQSDFANFLCRGVSRRMFVEGPAQMHGQGRRLTGFVFGKGDVLARIYDKTVELRVRGQTWPALLWRDADPDRPVWRVEFQFRRRGLTSFGLGSGTDALERRQELWRYGTRWLSLRQPSPNAQRSRWPEREVWRALREVVIGSPCSPLVRERVRQADELRLVRGFTGYASSLAALHGDDDLTRALRRTTPLVLAHLSSRGVRFADLVARKRQRHLDVGRVDAA